MEKHGEKKRTLRCWENGIPQAESAAWGTKLLALRRRYKIIRIFRVCILVRVDYVSFKAYSSKAQRQRAGNNKKNKKEK